MHPSVRTTVTSFAALLLASCADHSTAPLDVLAKQDKVAPQATGSPVVVMSGLDSPRGLAFGPEGALYVVEAGSTQINGPCVAVARGSNCYSGTGAITRLWKGRQERIASGLPSLYNPGALDIGGPQDIDFQGRGNGFVTTGWAANPALRAGLGANGSSFAAMIRVTPNGDWKIVADPGTHELLSNPAGGPLDSNPYGVLAEAGVQYLVDAGGNSLLKVIDGVVSTVAIFPSTPIAPGSFPGPFVSSEAVPTEVTRGPDGALYVSTLSGVPFLPGAARIYRVVEGQAPTVHAAGLTQVTDHAWGPDGTLYVLQYATAPFFRGPGRIVRIATNGARTTLPVALTNPTAIIVGHDGALYVSNRGNVASVGEVLRITP